MTSFAETSLLLTDLYELTMLQAYEHGGMRNLATFELFVRKLPTTRRFLVAAGLAQALEFLETAHLTDAELAWLEESGRFDAAMLKMLAAWRFRGDVDAVPEGTVVFADEPILRVTAPIAEAQLVETRLLNIVHLQTLVASKAARYRLAAGDRRLLDFGLRRAHGGEAGLFAARAAYLAGFDGSSNVLAEQRFGVPAAGTMAHSFVEAHDDEIAAFKTFARACPSAVVLLIDTYDTVACARRLPPLVHALADEGITVRGVRLDSGDLDALSREVRAVLDASDCRDVSVFASGGLDEHAIADLVTAGAPIEGFGCGTDLAISADHPNLDAAYKLVVYAGEPKRKRSSGKATWPGAKQVVRDRDADGNLRSDRLALLEDAPDGLLVPMMRKGRRISAPEPLADLRARVEREIAGLPRDLRRLDPGHSLEVEIDPALERLAAAVDRAH